MRENTRRMSCRQFEWVERTDYLALTSAFCLRSLSETGNRISGDDRGRVEINGKHINKSVLFPAPGKQAFSFYTGRKQAFSFKILLPF